MSIARYASLALALALAPAAAQEPARAVTVTLSDFKFDPTTIRLQARQPYVLRFVNSARHGHNFEAQTFFAAATVEAGDRLKIPDGKIEFRGGESIDIHLVAPGPASFPTRCTHFMHAAFGMTGRILVE